MSNYTKLSIFLLRVVFGWMFFYAGITKIVNPAWSAAGYLKGAHTFAGFYNLLASPGVLPIVNFINEWGLLLLGVSLIIGIGVRISSILGAFLMLFYYLPILQFPYPNPHSYIVDEHIVYIFALLFFAAIRAGRILGLENWCVNLPICRRLPAIRKIFG